MANKPKLENGGNRGSYHSYRTGMSNMEGSNKRWKAGPVTLLEAVMPKLRVGSIRSTISNVNMRLNWKWHKPLKQKLISCIGQRCRESLIWQVKLGVNIECLPKTKLKNGDDQKRYMLQLAIFHLE